VGAYIPLINPAIIPIEKVITIPIRSPIKLFRKNRFDPVTIPIEIPMIGFIIGAITAPKTNKAGELKNMPRLNRIPAMKERI
jgi:hypothetical protein